MFETKVLYDFSEFEKEEKPKENLNNGNIKVKSEKKPLQSINSAKKRTHSFDIIESIDKIETFEPVLKDRKVEVKEEVVEKESNKSGEISFTFKKNLPEKLSNNEKENFSMSLLNSLPNNNNKYKYMMDLVNDRVNRIEQFNFPTKQRLEISILDDHTTEIKENDPQVKLLFDQGSFQPFHLFHQEKIVSMGKIGKEVSRDGVTSYYIQSKHADQPIRTMITLDTVRGPYSIFPGQIVAMKGTNPTSKLFRPVGIRSPPMLKPHPITNEKFGVSIMIASGPFTTNQNLSYFPLNSLLKHVNRLQPDILLLSGPFVDGKHPEIIEGDVFFEGEECDYEELFTNIITKIMTTVKGVTVMITPSLRDFNHNISCYPQPPFTMPQSLQHFEDLIFLQDPSTVSLNEGSLIFGMTSSDIIQHLTSELASTSISEKPFQALKHILEQGNYYPLYPPNDDQSIDSTHLHLTKLGDNAPHLLITPSDLPPFVKVLNNVLCVNPGRVATEKETGSFAMLTLHPKSEEGEEENFIHERTRVDVYFV